MAFEVAPAAAPPPLDQGEQHSGTRIACKVATKPAGVRVRSHLPIIESAGATRGLLVVRPDPNDGEHQAEIRRSQPGHIALSAPMLRVPNQTRIFPGRFRPICPNCASTLQLCRAGASFAPGPRGEFALDELHVVIMMIRKEGFSGCSLYDAGGHWRCKNGGLVVRISMFSFVNMPEWSGRTMAPSCWLMF
jgi:hypothetical protein